MKCRKDKKIMEYLDFYDENGNYLGKESREVVHQKGLWHKTVHCWLYDSNSNVYFQIRADENKLYTTASGHVLAGETVAEAFGREIKEEIGISVDMNQAVFVDMIPFQMDKIKKDGTIWKDRAMANVYACEYHFENNFSFDPKEVTGLAIVNAKETLELFEQKRTQIEGKIITEKGIEQKNYTVDDFLVFQNETLMNKYGFVLKKVAELTK